MNTVTKFSPLDVFLEMWKPTMKAQTQNFSNMLPGLEAGILQVNSGIGNLPEEERAAYSGILEVMNSMYSEMQINLARLSTISADNPDSAKFSLKVLASTNHGQRKYITQLEEMGVWNKELADGMRRSADESSSLLSSYEKLLDQILAQE